MTSSIPVKPRVARAAVTDEEVAPDLPTLMERMERVRKYLRAEREYIKMVMIGGFFIFVASVFSATFPWPVYAAIMVLSTPWLYGWLNLPDMKLSHAFRNEVMPFLLRDYGRWNFALDGTHFPREVFLGSGLINPQAHIGISNILTGERFGVSLQIAVLSSWARSRFGMYDRRSLLEAWVANIRLPGLPTVPMLVLPVGMQPQGEARKDWVSTALTPSHNLWQPAGQNAAFPPELLARLMPLTLSAPQSRFAVNEGSLWLVVPGAAGRFNVARHFDIPLNEAAPYEVMRSQLVEVFTQIDSIVWPKTA